MTETIQSMELPLAEKLLGVGVDYSMKHVLSCFETAHWVKEQNEEADKIPEVILARNSILRNMICEQKKKFRFFTIESPFENTCPHCKGTGEIYKFFEKTVEVNCHICSKGTIKKNCPICKGSGRYIKRWKAGGGVNLICKKCQGQKQIEVKCTNCMGNGKIKKPVLTHELKSTTPCKRCKQLGYLPKKKALPPKKKKEISKPTPFQPLLTKQLADQIRAKL